MRPLFFVSAQASPAALFPLSPWSFPPIPIPSVPCFYDAMCRPREERGRLPVRHGRVKSSGTRSSLGSSKRGAGSCLVFLNLSAFEPAAAKPFHKKRADLPFWAWSFYDAIDDVMYDAHIRHICTYTDTPYIRRTSYFVCPFLSHAFNA